MTRSTQDSDVKNLGYRGEGPPGITHKRKTKLARVATGWNRSARGRGREEGGGASTARRRRPNRRRGHAESRRSSLARRAICLRSVTCASFATLSSLKYQITRWLITIVMTARSSNTKEAIF